MVKTSRLFFASLFSGSTLVWHDDHWMRWIPPLRFEDCSNMGLIQLPNRARPQFTQMLTHILEGAVNGRRLLIGWNACSPRLVSSARFESRAQDSQVISDFRSKLRQTEDMLGQLGFRLRELISNGL